MLKAELKAELDELDVEYPASATKPELEDLLDEARESAPSEDEAPADDVGDEPAGEESEDEESDEETPDEEEEEEPEDEPEDGDPKEDEPETPQDTTPDPVETSEARSVHDPSGKFIRTYSLAIHGENYAALAEQFATKIGGSVKVA